MRRVPIRVRGQAVPPAAPVTCPMYTAGSRERFIRGQNDRFRTTRAVRGSDGWKWMSSTPSSGSPGSLDR
jgi:hypothetical protein